MSLREAVREPLPVLAEHRRPTLREGEILGPPGTLGIRKIDAAAHRRRPHQADLREVLYHGAPLRGPAGGIAVVFQTFALYPWLTVQRERRAGSGCASAAARPRHVDAPHRRDRPDRSRRLSIGLSSRAFRRHAPAGRVCPRHRRAIRSLLLMDEPFSALDVLTAETLRTDFLDLWGRAQLPTADGADGDAQHRGSRADVRSGPGARHRIPGDISAQIPVRSGASARPLGRRVSSIVDEIYAILTSRMIETIERTRKRPRRLRAAAALDVSVNQI